MLNMEMINIACEEAGETFLKFRRGEMVSDSELRNAVTFGETVCIFLKARTDCGVVVTTFYKELSEMASTLMRRERSLKETPCIIS